MITALLLTNLYLPGRDLSSVHRSSHLIFIITLLGGGNVTTHIKEEISRA